MSCALPVEQQNKGIIPVQSRFLIVFIQRLTPIGSASLAVIAIPPRRILLLVHVVSIFIASYFQLFAPFVFSVPFVDICFQLRENFLPGKAWLTAI
jgi:hypothetical protein